MNKSKVKQDRKDSAAPLSNMVLGLDIGTTNISAVLLDYEKSEVIAHRAVPTPSSIACEPDFSEFDAEKICEQARNLVDALRCVYPGIRCIGLTGQMHGIVYLSEDGKVVSPFYNWQDGRGNRMFSETNTYCGEILSRTGYTCGSGYGFATLFYNKVNDLVPKDAKTFCTIMDYFALTLTGEKTPVVHTSNAASFGVYDVENNCFDIDALHTLGLSAPELPKITGRADVVGYYEGIPVCVPIGDNQASFFGTVKDEGESALVNFGTGSQVSVVRDRFQKIDAALEVRPYLFDNYLFCGSALCGGKAYAILEKFFRAYAAAAEGKADSQYEILNRLAGEAYETGESLLVSTAFCGTRQNPALRGTISGISDTNFTPGSLILGVLQGMAGELKLYFDRMETASVKKLVASGNAVKRNRCLQKVLADTFGIKMHLIGSDEEAAIGCALYAGVSCGILDIEKAKKIIKEEATNVQR